MSGNYNKITSKRRNQLESIRYLYNNDKIFKALSEIVRYIEQYPTDMHGRYLYARILMKCDRCEEAKEEFNKVFYSNSRNKYSGLVAMGEIEEIQGNTDKACQYYRKAIKESPYLERIAIRNLAHIERKKGNYEEAIRVISLLGDDNQSAMIEKARNLTLLNKIAESQDLLNSIVPTTEEESQELAIEKSSIAKVSGDYDKALAYLEEARIDGKKDTTYYVTVFEEAKINIKRNRYEEAIFNCEELIAANHLFDYEVYLMVGICNEKLKRTSKAIENYKMASYSKDSDTCSTAHTFLGTQAYLNGNEQEAERLIRLGMKKAKAFYPTRYGKLLNILLRQKRYEEADEVLKEAISKDKNIIRENEFYVAKLIIDKNLGRPISPEMKISYVCEQILNYSELEAIFHVDKKHIQRSGDKSRFNPELNAEKLFADLKIYLTPDYLVLKSVLDTYIVDFPNAGYKENQVTNKIAIITVPGTHNIITMYPIEDNLFIRPIDIKQTDEKTIIKTNDRTSKFYKKYGMPVPKKNAD